MPQAAGRPGSDAAALLAEAREMLPWMVEIRRDLHRHPELGLEEHRTGDRVCERLDELSIEHRRGLAQTGILGWISGSGPGPVAALRADLDALPLADAKDVAYRSTVAGRMHACGHDVHTTVLLGAARLLASRVPAVAGRVKLIFQPAEETVGGAKMLVEEGVLRDPPVDAIFGLHVEPGIDVGSFELRYGQRNASSDDLEITVHGRAGHGAYPTTGVDAIVVAAQVVSAIQTVVSRGTDARDSAVVSFGMVRGGEAPNIIARKVELVGTARTLDPRVRERVLVRVRETAEGVAAAMEARAEVVIRPSYDPLVNDDGVVDLVRESAKELVGSDRVHIASRANMGVEDFGFYLSHVPGAFFSLGVRNEERGIVHPVHSDRFDVDEECLAYGAAIQALNALTVLSR